VRTWRTLLAGLAALAAALVVFVLFSRNALLWNGSPGWSLQPSGRAYVVEVASVSPHGAAARAGVRAGDDIDLRSVPFAERVFLLALPAPLAGHALPIGVERGGRVRHLDVVPLHGPMSWNAWIGYVVLLWMAGFGALIAWRRPAMPEARLLSLALSCYVAGDALQWLTVPPAGLDLVFSAINSGGVLGAISLAALVRFASLFGRPISTLRRVVDGVAYAAAVLLACYGIAGAVALGTVWFDPAALYLGMWAVGIICCAQLLVILSGTSAIAASRGIERQRVAWAVISIGTLLAATVLEYVLNVLVPTYDMQLATQAAVNVVSIAAPVGLTYSVLSRRLLDIGFALNRAAVFSALSLLLVGSFMAAEWALGGWLVTANHVTGTAVNITLALALGFSVRFVHRRVDLVVDRLFFRKRHEQEAALLRFAREAPFITDLGTLLQRTVDEITRRSQAGSVAILTPDRNGTFAGTGVSGAAATTVDENDPALVALRARQEPVDLHEFATALYGEYAFPMVSRGELIGVLVCGLKRNGDPYAPDEIAALAALALGVGGALHTLSSAARGVHAEVLELRLEFAALRDDVRRMLDELGARRRTPAP
jgi:hypothetical protein